MIGRAGVTVYCAADLGSGYDSNGAYADGRTPTAELYLWASRASTMIGDEPDALSRLAQRCITRAVRKREGGYPNAFAKNFVTCIANGHDYEVRFR